jgi:hypothetical protein
VILLKSQLKGVRIIFTVANTASTSSSAFAASAKLKTKVM